MIPINIEPVNVDLSQNLTAQMKEMFQEVDKYNDLAVNADLYFKSLSETPKGEKEVSIRLNMPGKDIFIAKKSNDFVSASQEVYDTLKVSLKKHKDINKKRN